jgi:hypothetical protein
MIYSYTEPNMHNLTSGIIAGDPKGIRALSKRYIKELDDKINDWSRQKRVLSVELFRAWCTWNIEQLVEKRKVYEWYIKLATPVKELYVGGGNITEDMKNRAKSVPIDTILPFKNNTTCCIWHDEKTPSLHYYQKSNRVKCFGCGVSGDSIAVAMQVWGVSFIEAVKRLSQ